MTLEQEPTPEAAQSPPPQVHEPEPPVIPQRSEDEQDLGWGEGSGGRPDEWYLGERPPHW